MRERMKVKKYTIENCCNNFGRILEEGIYIKLNNLKEFENNSVT